MHHASMIGTQNCTKCTKIIFPRNYYPVKKYICSVRRKEYLEYMEIIHKRFHLFQCAYFFIDLHSPANWLTQNKEKHVQNGGMWKAYSLTHSIIMHWFHKNDSKKSFTFYVTQFLIIKLRTTIIGGDTQICWS